MIVQCCVCKQFRHGAGWLPLPLGFEADNVTHTYCPGCAARSMADMGEDSNSAARPAWKEKRIPQP